ncbi:AzlC family ABC transporter permease [Maledivibacter halophilus]|uniref:4-azaleucine resistance probable transporter AzlC n=1 Tax=Maledivibacter halophilus TaxID=36842 RepID=A0A1T5KR09_9FIRM|nr:AzlC family ABC transporter permease [Maledivibacter halophilus]SKC65915.1 4-azaleucine resistance probable transporter AzlC [Maledivibacter halophilus]
MVKDCKVKYSFKDGVIDSLPIVIGFIPIAMAFGILSKTTGITMIHSVLFSVLVFAGASQFIALNLLMVGAGIGEIILTTLLVNFRHFLMSASIATRMTDDMKRWSPFIAFGITDEVFSVVSFKKGMLTKEYMVSLEFMTYFAWVSGTALGYFVGGILSTSVKSSMGVALYAMFAAILIPEIKKSTKAAILAGLSGIINTLCKYFLTLPQGWSIVVSIVLVSFLGLYLFKEGEVAEYE